MMYGPGYGYGGYGTMMGGFGGLLFVLFGLLVLAGLVLLAVWAFRSAGGSGQRSNVSSSASDACTIAKVRYAKGEITKEQYEEICRTLAS